MKKTKILASVMALAMCFSAMPMSAFADTTEITQESNSQTALTDVYLTAPTQYTVRIPKEFRDSTDHMTDNSISLGQYSVKGDIPGDKILYVRCDGPITFTSPGKEDVDGYSSGSDGFTYERLMIDEATASIAVRTNEKLTAGTWHTVINFSISLEDKPEGL